MTDTYVQEGYRQSQQRTKFYVGVKDWQYTQNIHKITNLPNIDHGADNKRNSDFMVPSGTTTVNSRYTLFHSSWSQTTIKYNAQPTCSLFLAPCPYTPGQLYIVR